MPSHRFPAAPATTTARPAGLPGPVIGPVIPGTDQPASHAQSSVPCCCCCHHHRPTTPPPLPRHRACHSFFHHHRPPTPPPILLHPPLLPCTLHLHSPSS